ncbi:hypothetical protein [Actinacidiphila glaucinigra]|uniref:hypothetical protein n=1 Tax=Actinacidiphila glaucinigra TaxID=235986 RepID=UPI000B775B8C|nr:hypothetical protein [Actinacidiphila glaucinigra]
MAVLAVLACWDAFQGVMGALVHALWAHDSLDLDGTLQDLVFWAGVLVIASLVVWLCGLIAHARQARRKAEQARQQQLHTLAELFRDVAARGE